MSIEERVRITDPAVMRALAHPARLAIMEYLSSVNTEATATECAEVVGLTPSATSYHLRALAKAGLLEDAPSRGDARERVWRSKGRSFAAETERHADPQARAAEDALLEVVLARQDQRLRGWHARERDEPPEWYRASLIGETIIAVTAEELQRLNDEISRMIRAYHRSERAGWDGGGAGPDPRPGSRPIGCWRCCRAVASSRHRVAPTPVPAGPSRLCRRGRDQHESGAPFVE